MKPTEELAKFVADMTFAGLPEGVVHQARLFVLETAAAAILGTTSSVARKMADILAGLGERQEAALIGVGAKSSCRTAAFYNTFALDVYDAGGGYDYGVVHPGKNVVPTALTVASCLEKSGKDLITAVVAGIETETRIDAAVLPSHIFRGHYDDGTVGCFGAAAAAGKLFGLEAVAMTDAFGNVGAIGPMTLGGANMLMSPGCSAALGQGAASAILAVMLAKEGIGGARDILEGTGGFCSGLSDKYDLSKITEGLGKEYEIMKCYFKPYIGCRLSHAVRECALVLREEYRIVPADIAKVLVKINELANLVIGFQSASVTERTAIGCGPYLVAAALLYGEVGPGVLSEERRKDPKIYELMDKTEIVIESGVSKKFIPGGCVEVITQDGKKFSHTVEDPDWSSDRRPTDGQLADKFRTYTASVLTSNQIEKAIEMTLGLERVDNVAKLMDLLCPEK